jgi:o-succinylbenzoate synthase
MRLDRVELREIHLELTEPFEISSGSRQHRRILLLRLEGERGGVGWGECVAAEDPGYSYETTETAWHVLSRFLLPAIVGVEAADLEELLRPMRWVRGHPMAKAAVEMGVWDFRARQQGVALAQALNEAEREAAAHEAAHAAPGEAVPDGAALRHATLNGAPIHGAPSTEGSSRESSRGSGPAMDAGPGRPVPTAIPVGVSVGLQPSTAELIRKIEGYVAEGYARIKIKIKPGRDVEMLTAVRERFPDTPLMADANSAYTLDDLHRLRALDALGLTMIEQPLAHDDLLDHARLQREIETPVCLDESIRSAGDARLALELGSGRVINIKPGRVGGFGESLKIHALCRRAGVPVWCGGMLESGVGRAANIALATLPGFTLPGDISASRRYWARDIVDPEFELVGGTMAIPTAPGLGVTPDEDRIETLTHRKEEFRA